ncbi:DoxX family protein [Massilia sp. PWRC2]|uniref:DoxX family protein n=1 Tax=Massilia sp. PWRC2 TaxID=2804626 RepID=UPI003CEC38D6
MIKIRRMICLMGGERAGRCLLAAFFMAGGVLHFLLPATYAKVMPPWLPWHGALVAVSGVAEIAGGAGVLLPAVRRAAGRGLIALSVAVLPANVQMLQDGLAAGRPDWQLALLVLRLPLQAALIWWIWLVAARVHATPEA